MAARSSERSARPPGWTEIVIRAPAAAEDEVAAMLVERGALGASVDQAAPGAPRPPVVSIRAYFDAAGNVAGAAWVAGALAGLGGEAASARVVSVSGLEDGRWVERWIASLVPFDVGRRFRIEPGPLSAEAFAPPDTPPRAPRARSARLRCATQTRRRFEPVDGSPDGSGYPARRRRSGSANAPAGLDTGRLTIRITPSRAFGTGEHPTTRLCLEAMETLPLEGRSFLDVGTGSGILAIAAVLLGAARVVAIDVDPEAMEVARTNAVLNAPPGAIRLVCGGPESISAARFDVAAANLNAAVLESAVPSIARLLEPGGRLVASGLLREEADRFALLASRSGLAPLGIAEREGWARTLHEAARA